MTRVDQGRRAAGEHRRGALVRLRHPPHHPRWRSGRSCRSTRCRSGSSRSGFFDQNPSIDVAPTPKGEGGTCHTGGEPRADRGAHALIQGRATARRRRTGVSLRRVSPRKNAGCTERASPASTPAPSRIRPETQDQHQADAEDACAAAVVGRGAVAQRDHEAPRSRPIPPSSGNSNLKTKLWTRRRTARGGSTRCRRTRSARSRSRS